MFVSEHVLYQLICPFRNRMDLTSEYRFLVVLPLYRIILAKLDLWQGESFQIKLNPPKGWLYCVVSVKGRRVSIGKIPICMCFILFFWQRTETMLKAKPFYRFKYLATVMQALRIIRPSDSYFFF